jgi:triosephosphate isomerase (EC 5.3.1.1)
MSRRMLVAGNWKMHTTSGEGATLVQDIADLLEMLDVEAEVAVCPPFTGLKSVSTLIELDHLTIALGAQDCHWEPEGAYTGAIAPRMLADLRCSYVIVGHSERREYFGETDETVNRKVRAIFDAGMTPIMCVGESLAVREALETEAFVRQQVRVGAEGLTPEQAARLVVAYEPIWAIGTGAHPHARGCQRCRALDPRDARRHVRTAGGDAGTRALRGLGEAGERQDVLRGARRRRRAHRRSGA